MPADELEALLRADELPWAAALSTPARDPGRLAVRAGVERDLASLKVG
jgi:hypothetical protein